MPSWRPDWRRLMDAAPILDAESAQGHVYLVADSHLGDARAPVPGFLKMLEGLPEAGVIVFLGDLFKVWLALPRFWDPQVRMLLEGFERIRARGTRVWFVVGNREYFLPRDPLAIVEQQLPFDRIIHEMAVMEWAGRRYGLTHGDLVNREDAQYLKWRRLSRGRAFAALFRALPPPLARRIAAGLERSLASTNQDIKITYPRHELEAFAATVLPGLDGFFIGHFHRDETITVPGADGAEGDAGPALRIVPDWFGTRRVLRLHRQGAVETVEFPDP